MLFRSVISASHNPYQDNGIKFFSRDGFKLGDDKEHEIEELTFTGRIDDIRPTAAEIGKATRIDTAGARYLEHVKRSFPRGVMLEGMKIVVDCGHGAAYKVGPWVFKELGAKTIEIGVEPDGRNINDGVGALHPEVAAQAVKDHGADLGICLDGDGDRCLFVDENGELVDGDHVLGWQQRHRRGFGLRLAGSGGRSTTNAAHCTCARRNAERGAGHRGPGGNVDGPPVLRTNFRSLDDVRGKIGRAHV